MDSLIEKLEEAGIDTAKGMEFCIGNEELYIELLREYVRSSEDKIGDTKRFLEELDMKSYGTLVHSMKSTSKTIGANDLSEACLALEKAADSMDIDYIEANHGRMIEEYKDLIKALKEAGVQTDPGSGDGDDDGVMEFMP